MAINKPPGILVHRTSLSEDKVFVLQLLREQLGGARVFPVHRLDRATSGVLMFAKNAHIAGILGAALMRHTWKKKYLALVRGYPTPSEGVIDYPLSDPETGRLEPLEAQTEYRTLATGEQPWAIGLRYPTARFALLEVTPLTGRRQQIRKHLSHLRHPIIGDTQMGDVKFKRYFRAQGWPERLMLHASSLHIQHPKTAEALQLHAPTDQAFQHVLQLTGCLI